MVSILVAISLKTPLVIILNILCLNYFLPIIGGLTACIILIIKSNLLSKQFSLKELILSFGIASLLSIISILFVHLFITNHYLLMETIHYLSPFIGGLPTGLIMLGSDDFAITSHKSQSGNDTVATGSSSYGPESGSGGGDKRNPRFFPKRFIDSNSVSKLSEQFKTTSHNLNLSYNRVNTLINRNTTAHNALNRSDLIPDRREWYTEELHIVRNNIMTERAIIEELHQERRQILNSVVDSNIAHSFPSGKKVVTAKSLAVLEDIKKALNEN